MTPPTGWPPWKKSLLWGRRFPSGNSSSAPTFPPFTGRAVLNEGPLVHLDPHVPLDVARTFIEELIVATRRVLIHGWTMG